MATKLAKIIADFTTSLATSMAVGATSVSLQSATDDDGNALPAGVYFFAIDGNNSQKEHIVATLSGTSLTGISSISRQGVQTSGVARTHRVGATVTLTDFAHIKYINDLLTATTDLDSTTPLKYDGTATISNANHLATKAYVDGVAIAGGADASTTVKGITKMSVAPASPTAPIAVGDNDGRVPTQNENDALVGTSGTPVSSSNKLVDAADVSATSSASKIARADSSGKLDGWITSFDYQVFTTSGTWTKPSGLTGNELVRIQAWGAGGGGGSCTAGNPRGGGGGGGGAYVEFCYRASDLSATETVTIGAGGTPAAAGGNTTFGTHLTAYGGGGGAAGDANSTSRAGGGGGGTLSAGGNASTTTPGNGGNPAGSTGDNSGFGGGGGHATSNGGNSAFGGGGGAGQSNATTAAVGGSSVYGGGGGGSGSGSGGTSTGGSSVFGGAGGAGLVGDGNGIAGTAPGGGGGGAGRATSGTSTGGSGARGEVRVWVYRS